MGRFVKKVVVNVIYIILVEESERVGHRRALREHQTILYVIILKSAEI